MLVYFCRSLIELQEKKILWMRLIKLWWDLFLSIRKKGKEEHWEEKFPHPIRLFIHHRVDMKHTWWFHKTKWKKNSHFRRSLALTACLGNNPLSGALNEESFRGKKYHTQDQRQHTDHSSCPPSACGVEYNHKRRITRNWKLQKKSYFEHRCSLDISQAIHFEMLWTFLTIKLTFQNTNNRYYNYNKLEKKRIKSELKVSLRGWTIFLYYDYDTLTFHISLNQNHGTLVIEPTYQISCFFWPR